ncbi:hypothetical protein WJX72_011190 [[Myrmecia] bisecta]|uniref:BOD1/SHG1 domain-containing protein n=1 Tax=[Myrmecia] bisecta TaxID=41462 RepID=A0AAW1PDQ7_9CHLO
MGSINPDDCTAVLNKIMADGTFDELRQQAVAELKSNVVFKEYVEELVANSETLNSSKVEKKTQKENFEQLRKELEAKVMDEALNTTWGALTSSEKPISRLIDQRVHEALCAVYAGRQQR